MVFRYFYAITAYDWNGTDKTDLSTMFSLESALNFGANNMVVPGSKPIQLHHCIDER